MAACRWSANGNCRHRQKAKGGESLIMTPHPTTDLSDSAWEFAARRKMSPSATIFQSFALLTTTQTRAILHLLARPEIQLCPPLSPVRDKRTKGKGSPMRSWLCRLSPRRQRPSRRPARLVVDQLESRVVPAGGIRAPHVTIAGTKFEDLNANGVRDTANPAWRDGPSSPTWTTAARSTRRSRSPSTDAVGKYRLDGEHRHAADVSPDGATATRLDADLRPGRHRR